MSASFCRSPEANNPMSVELAGAGAFSLEAQRVLSLVFAAPGLKVTVAVLLLLGATSSSILAFLLEFF